MLAYCIQKADLDLRKTFYSSIVLSGGSTLFKGTGSSPLHVFLDGAGLHTCGSLFFAGFGDRLLSEMKKLTPKDIKIRVSSKGHFVMTLSFLNFCIY